MNAKKLACTVLSVMFSILAVRAQERPVARPSQAMPVQINSQYGNVPLMFEANQGQTDSQVRFLSHGSGYSVFLTAGGMVLALPTSDTSSPKDVAHPPGNSTHTIPLQLHQREGTRARKSYSLAIELAGASRNPVIVGEEPLGTKINYFIGRDPEKWKRNIPTYRRIRYRNVYPGIDLLYYGNNHKIEYDFDLAPGADPSEIQFSVKGADALEIDSTGNLVLTKDRATLQFQMPVLYQENQGTRNRVNGTYVLRDAGHVGFAVGNYDSTKPLVIDPVLVYSTLLGGSNDDFGQAIAVDSAGDAYVTGITDSPDFPLASIGSYSPSQFRMFLTELDPTGSALLFADYFGGTTGSDQAYAIALDSSGNPYVTGSTDSSDFPLVQAYQSTFSGSEDAFLVKFSADGSSISYSTYLGGSILNAIGGAISQVGTSVVVDAAGEALVTGFTQATDFPRVSAYQYSVSADQFGNWGQYGFLSKFASDGKSLVYSTYLGGSTYSTSSCSGCFPVSLLLSVATDSSGNAYVTGYTNTSDFPVTAGAFMTTSPANPLSDIGFVSKFTNSGAIAYSTYLGGLSDSILSALAVDSSGSAYVTGYDSAGDAFPIVTTSICDPSASACNGAIVAKLDPTGSSLLYSTFLGTSNNMLGQAIQVDASGDAFIVGSDLQFDLSNPIEQFAGNGDVVVAEINPTATTLLMATPIGGQGWEAAADSLALDKNGAVYAVGVTQSTDFPATQGVLQTGLAGGTDAFIAKIDPNTNAPAVSMAPFSLQFASQNVGSTSAPQTSILRNMGSSTLTITSITSSGDFAETDDCGSSVAAASFCTLTVTFTPTATGTRTGAITVTDDAQGSPHSLALTGTGVSGPSSFSALPSTLTFSSSPVGTTTTAQTVAITNTSNATLQISGMQLTGDFAATSNNCGSVASNGTCTIQVSFTPTAAGTRTGVLQLTDFVGDSPTVIALSGSGVDFSTSATSSSAAVTAGGSASYQLSVASIGGSFTGSVSFACNGAPEFATCTVDPNSVSPGVASSTVMVNVTTSGPVAQAHGVRKDRRDLPAFWLSTQLLLVGLVVLGVNDRRRFRICILAAVASMLLLLAGCSGGTGAQSYGSNTTPSGTYTLHVVATSGNLQHITQLTLVVQ